MSKRAAAYIRVSSESQVEGFSLQAQERAIRAYAQQHGWDVVTWYRDEGLSARVDDITKRPAFRTMLEDAKAKRFDAIIVHKLDRFARNRRVAFNAFSELADARIGFVSIAENMDYSSPAGQLMLTMLVGMSQFYSDNLSFETRKGKAERKRQGMYNGLLPFGVTLNPHGLPVPDARPWACNLATRAELVPFQGLELAFTLAAQGAKDRDIARELTARGFRTTGNRGQNPFSKATVRAILQNRFYLGELPDGEAWVPGRHAPIIDQALFDAAQTERLRNRTRKLTATSRRKPWALSGMIYCRECGAPMRNNGSYAGKTTYVMCGSRVEGRGCDLPTYKQDEVLTILGEWLASWITAERSRERALATYRHNQSSNVDHTAQRLVIERKLVRLRELYLDGDVGKDEYQQRRDMLTAEKAELPEIVLIDDAKIEALWQDVTTVAATFTDASPAEQQDICRALFDRVTINRERVVEVHPRPEIRPFFRCGGSDGLPSHDIGNSITAILLSLPPKTPNRRAKTSLSDELVAWVWTQQGRSLRDLAAELDVSYETVRQARLRRPVKHFG
jgi:DNA invertase Pin-like site-specific DNA recombinase